LSVSFPQQSAAIQIGRKLSNFANGPVVPVFPFVKSPASSKTVRIYHAVHSSGEPGRIEKLCHVWLDDADRRRAELFRRSTTRNQHVIGRGMSRRLLAGGKLDPCSIRLEIEQHGKPVVSGPAEARRPFNVTHTDGLVMCGIAEPPYQTIGIDVERLSRCTSPELADRYFSKPEIDFLNGCQDEPSRRQTFLRIWTLKESFIKAIGTGLSMPLADFAFDDIRSEQPTLRLLNPDLESNLHWRFYSFEPRPGFVAALAVALENEAHAGGYELIDFAAVAEEQGGENM